VSTQHEPRIEEHGDAVRFLEQLVVDLKKRECRLEHEPITMARLDAARVYIATIQASLCRAWPDRGTKLPSESTDASVAPCKECSMAHRPGANSCCSQ
jgi:hypothetical protein